MKERTEEPTRDQLLAMAYADGELDGPEREAFERGLAERPELAREVAHYQKLAILARRVAPPEPKDVEWQRLEGQFLQRTGWTAGWILLVAGVGLLLAGLVGEIVRSDLDPLLEVALALASAGLFVLFLLVLRRRLRTLPYDPYTEVDR